MAYLTNDYLISLTDLKDVDREAYKLICFHYDIEDDDGYWVYVIEDDCGPIYRLQGEL